ncbi:MAG: hypothetical protein HYU52_10395 [Acidobacteria bacterium]|nr:hypothetical protein [Acidobacteriota bacterium]
MAEPPRPAITLLALGPVTTDCTEHLVRQVGAIEQIDLRLEHDAPLAAHVAEINRAIDAATCDWILLVRAHETVGEALAAEIAMSAGPSPRAWGYRIRTQPTYRGKPLTLEPLGDGELRLLHRRHVRFLAGGDPKVQGTVIRTREPLEASSFASSAEHASWLAERGTRRGFLGRLGVFAVDALRCGPLRAQANGLVYLWVNSGWKRDTSRR